MTVPTYRYARTPFWAITDESLQGLIGEVVEARKIQKLGSVLDILQQALKPNGELKDQKFQSGEFLPSDWMHKRLSQCRDKEVYWLCHDLARIYGAGSLENHGRTQLYSFLNKVLIQKKKKLKARP